MAPRKPRPSFEERLQRLSRLRDEADPDTVRRELRAALADKSQHLVARAARVAGELGLGELVPELEAAFDRLLIDPIGRDKGCVAKTAIARALSELEVAAEPLYLRGAAHVQLEPSFGKPEDTAAELRGVCGFALVRCGYPEVMSVLVELLVDREAYVRKESARALGDSGRGEAEPVLRLKAHLGDKEPEVIGECLGALLHLAPQRNLAFVVGFLGSDDAAVVEAAALALGESRLEEAVEPLWQACEANVGDLRRTLLVALALTRREPAFARLLGLVAEAPSAQASAAVTVLAIHRHDERLRQRVETAIAGRRDGKRELGAVVEREFGES